MDDCTLSLQILFLQIIEQIREIICIKLNGVNRVASDDVNIMLCRNWGFTDDVFG